MKIRIKGNSLRYRLTRTDIATFTKNGYLEEQTNFGGDILTYSLEGTGAAELYATFKDNRITLYMPYAMAAEWIGTDRVGYESKTNDFYLLVEKDFKCLDNVAEDQSDNYPNPLANK
ncbi:MAG: hypothetical protein ABI367_00700 [Mucilaginibacter sp.]